MPVKFTKADLDLALDDLSTLRFFPGGAGARASVGALLARMVPHREALRWLVETMVNRVGEWHGPTELRGVLCWRYQPADGVEQTCSLPGFRAADAEAKALDEHAMLKAGGWADPADQRAIAGFASRLRIVGGLK